MTEMENKVDLHDIARTKLKQKNEISTNKILIADMRFMHFRVIFGQLHIF